jgi:hypothetical protein
VDGLGRSWNTRLLQPCQYPHVTPEFYSFSESREREKILLYNTCCLRKKVTQKDHEAANYLSSPQKSALK